MKIKTHYTRFGGIDMNLDQFKKIGLSAMALSIIAGIGAQYVDAANVVKKENKQISATPTIAKKMFLLKASLPH